MPKYLSLAAFLVGGWVVFASDEVLTGIVPAATAGLLALLTHAVWQQRGRAWHDGTVILLLLPAIASAVWLTVGGLVMGVERSNEQRLLFEVGPGVALTGLLCTLISYHGRHHPSEKPQASGKNATA